MSAYVGSCGAYLWFGIIERQHSANELAVLLYVQAGCALAILLVFYAAFPSTTRPKGPAPEAPANAHKQHAGLVGMGTETETDALLGTRGNTAVQTGEAQGQLAPTLQGPEGRMRFKAALALVLRDPSILAFVLSAGVANGVYSAWLALCPILFSKLESRCSAQSGSSGSGDMFAFITTLGYAIGGMAGGALADHCFPGRLKAILVGALVLSAAASGVLVLVIPPPFVPEAIQINLPCGWPQQVTIGTLACLLGVGVGATNPAAFELLAETAFPAPEGITANAMLLTNILSAIVLTAIVPLVSSKMVNVVMFGCVTACLVLATVGNGSSYKRRRAQQQQQQHAADSAASSST